MLLTLVSPIAAPDADFVAGPAADLDIILDQAAAR
jgi:hypothetical protein